MLLDRIIKLIAKGMEALFKKINFNKKEDKSLLIATIQADKEGKYTKATEDFLNHRMTKLYVARKMHSLVKKIYTKNSKVTQRDIHIINQFFMKTHKVSLFDNPTKKHLKKIIDDQQREALLAAQRIAGGSVTLEDILMILDIKLLYELEVKKRKKRKIKNMEDGSTSKTVYSDNKKEIIKFYNSSWLVQAEYHYDTMKAIFTFVGSKKLYTFYEVPRIALYALQKINGRGMWDGFGVFHSSNPLHWIRGRKKK